MEYPAVKKRVKEYFEKLEHPYKTEAGVKMCKALPNCKNQCWNCHLCEDAFGYEHFDSLSQINRTENSGYVKSVDHQSYAQQLYPPFSDNSHK